MGRARDMLKLVIGQVAEVALPTLGREIDEVRNPDRAAKLKQAIVYARLRRAHARGDAAGMDDALSAFWKGREGDRFHGSFAQTRFQHFQEHHAPAFDVLAEHIAANGGAFNRLVEIGCGDGQVLAECARRLPSVTQAVGIDINETVIARASAEYAHDPRLSFVNADARGWLTAHPQPGTVMVSNGGVLEYFAPDKVDELYQALALALPAAVVLVEPAAADHDLDRQPESYAFGREYSFSHNHRHRLAKAGFDVVLEQEAPAFGHRLILMIAVSRKAP